MTRPLAPRLGASGPSDSPDQVLLPSAAQVAARRLWGSLGFTLVLGLAPLLVYLAFVVAHLGDPVLSGGDEAILEMGARDALHLDARVGPYSRFGWYHPGPALFYWYAPFYALVDQRQTGLNLAAMVLSVLGLAYVLATVHRCLGRRAGLLAALVVVGFTAVSGIRWANNSWNPVMVIVPAVVLGVAAAAVADGRRWHLVVAGAAASFAVQTHIGAASVVAALSGVAVLGAALAMRRERRFWALAVGATALVCALAWALPLHQQVTGDPGNLGEIRAFTQASSQTRGAREVLARTAPQLTLTRMDLVESTRSAVDPEPRLSAWRFALLLAFDAALLAATAVGVRRGDRFSAALTGGAVVATVALTWSLRYSQGPLYGYLTLTATSLGFLGWLGLALTRVPFEPWTRLVHRLRPSLPWVLAACSVAVCAQAVHVAGLPGAYGAPTPPGSQTTTARLLARVDPDDGPVMVTFAEGGSVRAALVANQLERAGYDTNSASLDFFDWGVRRAPNGCERTEVRGVPTISPDPAGFVEIGTIGETDIYLRSLTPAAHCR